MTFRVGQKVVCIKKEAWTGIVWEAVPKYQAVYIIRTISVSDGIEFLRFEEIRNPPWPYIEGRYECEWWSGQFRPFVERKTDIGAFTEIARKVSDSAPVIARNRSRIQAIAHPEKSA